MKKFLKNQKGITLIALLTTIIILAILLGIVATNIDIGADIRNYNYMRADIELLESKIMTYYNETNSLPTKGTVITNPNLNGQASSRDNTNYYQIDINKLYNVTLNYGGGSPTDKDIYIVNEQSHEVYYLQGAYYEDTLYHTEI